jgi:hypothetical protein
MRIILLPALAAAAIAAVPIVAQTTGSVTPAPQTGAMSPGDAANEASNAADPTAYSATPMNEADARHPPAPDQTQEQTQGQAPKPDPAR